MRRMPTEKQINLINELNKYLAFEEDHSLTINTPVSFEEQVGFSEGLVTDNIVNPDQAGDIYLNDEGITIGEALVVNPEGLVIMDLPTADPQVEGALWNDNGVLKISAGE